MSSDSAASPLAKLSLASDAEGDTLLAQRMREHPDVADTIAQWHPRPCAGRLRAAPVGARVQLTPEEVAYGRAIGLVRLWKNQSKGTADLSFSEGLSDEAKEVNGVWGEMAFCKLHNQDLEVHDTTCRNASNDTFDARLPCGLTVDVKTTPKRNAPLLVAAHKSSNPPDVYALMIQHSTDTYEFAGMALSQYVLSPTLLGTQECATVASRSRMYRFPYEELLDYHGVYQGCPRRSVWLAFVERERARGVDVTACTPYGVCLENSCAVTARECTVGAVAQATSQSEGMCVDV